MDRFTITSLANVMVQRHLVGPKFKSRRTPQGNSLERPTRLRAWSSNRGGSGWRNGEYSFAGVGGQGRGRGRGTGAHAGEILRGSPPGHLLVVHSAPVPGPTTVLADTGASIVGGHEDVIPIVASSVGTVTTGAVARHWRLCLQARIPPLDVNAKKTNEGRSHPLVRAKTTPQGLQAHRWHNGAFGGRDTALHVGVGAEPAVEGGGGDACAAGQLNQKEQ